MTMPSREFLVRQACLNAMSASLNRRYLTNLIWLNDNGGVDLSYFEWKVRIEFRKLVLKFVGAEVSYCK